MKVFTYICYVIILLTLQIGVLNGDIVNKLLGHIKTEDNANDLIAASTLETGGAVSFLAGESDTASELRLQLALRDKSRDKLAKIMGEMQNNTFNKIYIHKSLKLQSQFQKRLGDMHFKTEFVQMSTGSKVAKTINNEAKKVKIFDLVRAHDIDNDTLAIVFSRRSSNLQWKNAFKDSKNPMKFKGIKKTFNAKSMTYSGDLKFGEIPKLNAAALEVPLSGTNTRLLLLLPKKANGLNQLVRGLVKENYWKVSEKLHKKNIELNLPKFKIDVRGSLRPLLLTMGVKTGLSENARFDNLLNVKKGTLSSYMHDFNQNRYIEFGTKEIKAASAIVVQFQKSLKKNTYNHVDTDEDNEDKEETDNETDDENEEFPDIEVLPGDELFTDESESDELSIDESSNTALYKKDKNNNNSKNNNNNKVKNAKRVTFDSPFMYAVLSGKTPLYMGTLEGEFK